MIKRICSILTAVVLTACLTACGDGEISEKEYQSFLSDMGISGVESAVEGAVYVEAFSNKIDTAYYQPDKIGGEQYRLIAQTCGEEKKTEMYGCYVLGEDGCHAGSVYCVPTVCRLCAYRGNQNRRCDLCKRKSCRKGAKDEWKGKLE